VKVKIKSYAGPNTAITEEGDRVRIPVNVPHPAAGEVYEAKASAVTKHLEIKVTIAKEEHKPVKVPDSEKKK